MWIASQDLPYPEPSVFPVSSIKNRTLATDRMAARLATDAMFRCIDQATAYAGLQNDVFENVFYYEVARTYQLPNWPMLDLCQPPVEPGFPYGNPEAPIGYSKCHSGDLLYVFGNIIRMGLNYRDAQGDAEFSREMVDRWAAFAWRHDPNIENPKNRLVEAWKPAIKDDFQLMVLDWEHGHMSPMRDIEQCAWLDLPYDYYMQ